MEGRAQLGPPLMILLALGGALALAGPGARTSEPRSPAPPGLDPAALERISLAALPEIGAGVERVRGLTLERTPEPKVVTSEHLNRLGADEAERAGTLDQVAAGNAVGRITGLIAADEDLGAALASTGDLAAAAYDSRRERLYVVADAVAVNRALVEFVLAHELDHVLEDQRFGLPEGKGLDDDEALAAQALTEGSATAVMTEYAARYLNPFELVAAAETIDEGAADVPDVLIDQLTWAYLGGRRFVDALRGLAGSWKLVDHALGARLPASTEQVLHPRKYVVDERPEAVRIDAAPLRARGWRRADRNAFGELTTSLLLEVGADAEQAADAAAGWGGDRYELWRREVAPGECEPPCRQELVLVARWRWDTAGDAREFARAIGRYAREGLGGSAARPGLWRIDGGWLALAAGSEQTGLAFAPDAKTARAVASAQAPR